MKVFERRGDIRRRLFRSPPVPNSGLGFKDGGEVSCLRDRERDTPCTLWETASWLVCFAFFVWSLFSQCCCFQGTKFPLILRLSLSFR